MDDNRVFGEMLLPVLERNAFVDTTRVDGKAMLSTIDFYSMATEVDGDGEEVQLNAMRSEMMK